MTNIVCTRTECFYNILCVGYFGCKATAIGITEKGCDTYFNYSETLKEIEEEFQVASDSEKVD